MSVATDNLEELRVSVAVSAYAKEVPADSAERMGASFLERII